MNRRLYECRGKGCGIKVPILSKGLCPMCRDKQRRKEGTKPIYKNKIKQISDKTKNKKEQKRDQLNTFFEYHYKQLVKNPYSIESGEFIPDVTSANLAHVLPKRSIGGFPSVAAHKENCVYLSLQEHNTFDKLLDERNYSRLEELFPNSWEIICRKAEKMLSLCEERNKMYYSFKEYLKNK